MNLIKSLEENRESIMKSTRPTQKYQVLTKNQFLATRLYFPFIKTSPSGHTHFHTYKQDDACHYFVSCEITRPKNYRYVNMAKQIIRQLPFLHQAHTQILSCSVLNSVPLMYYAALIW